MKKFTTMDDIEKENLERNRRRFVRNVSKDARDILDNIFKVPEKVKKKKNWFLKILKWLGILFLVLFIINFILGNIWLFRELVKSLFFP